MAATPARLTATRAAQYRSASVRTAIGVAAVVVSAIVYGSCFPPAPRPWLTALALVPLLAVLRDARPGAAVGLAWLWTAVMAYTVNDWFPRAVSGYFGQPPIVGAALFLGVTTFTAALEYMAFALAYRRLVRRRGALVPLLAAAAWVGADLARATLLGGDPWAFAGYSQVGVPLLVQVADVTGIYGPTFVVVAVAAGLTELVAAAGLAAAPPPRARALRGFGLALSAAVAVAAYGAMRLREAVHAPAASIPVAVVQGNVDVGTQWREELYGVHLRAHLDLTRTAVERFRPQLVVWPENALTVYLDVEGGYGPVIAEALGSGGTQLVAGGPRHDRARDAYYNSAYLVSERGSVLGWYDKQHLLPFAERFPPWLDLFRRGFGRVRRFVPGAAAPPLPTAIGPAGVLVCNEAMLPDLAAAHVRAGAEMLINLANDSWLADPKFSEPVFAMVRVRAIEQRRWVLRASTAGPSGLVDPWGRVVVRSTPYAADVVGGRIATARTLTVYARIGDAFAAGCLLIAVAATLRPARAEDVRAGDGASAGEADERQRRAR